MAKEKCRPILTGKTICATPDLFNEGNLGKGPFQGFSAEAQAVFDLMDSDPPVALKTIMATFIDSQVASGNFALLVQFILYGMDTAANSVINWVSASFNAINVGSPHTPWSGVAHSGFAGFGPDGATLYMNAGIQPTDFLRDDFRDGLWLFTNDDSSDTPVLFGCRGASTAGDHFMEQLPISRSGLVSKANTNVGDVLITTEPGDLFQDHSLYEIVRPDSSNQDFDKNGVQLGTEADASDEHRAVDIYDGAFNNNGSVILHMDVNITARYVAPNTGFDSVNFHANLLIMLQSMAVPSYFPAILFACMSFSFINFLMLLLPLTVT